MNLPMNANALPDIPYSVAAYQHHECIIQGWIKAIVFTYSWKCHSYISQMPCKVSILIPRQSYSIEASLDLSLLIHLKRVHCHILPAIYQKIEFRRSDKWAGKYLDAIMMKMLTLQVNCDVTFWYIHHMQGFIIGFLGRGCPLNSQTLPLCLYWAC